MIGFIKGLGRYENNANTCLGCVIRLFGFAKMCF